MKRSIMKKIIILLSLIVTVFGQPSFTAHSISTSADLANYVHAADVDGDGDMDVLSASLWDDKIAWYENDGSESFTEHVISISAGYHSIMWDATNDLGDPVGAGVYLYQLQAKDFVKTRKMVLLK